MPKGMLCVLVSGLLFSLATSSKEPMPGIEEVDEALALNPAGTLDRVSGPALVWPKGGNYTFRVSFAFQDSMKAEERAARLTRVIVYRWNKPKDRDCDQEPCWIRIAQFSSENGPPTKNIAISSGDRLFLGWWSAWHESKTPSQECGWNGPKWRQVECPGKTLCLDLCPGPRFVRTSLTVAPAK